MAKRNYYEVLGIDRDATDAQIKAAYRGLARKYHPDVNGAPGAEAKFKEATQAYEVISDAKKRKAYDRFGQAGGPAMGGGGFSMNFEEVLRAASAGGRTGGFGGMGLTEILEKLRGGFSGGGRSRTRKKPARRKGKDLQHEVTIAFLDAVAGTTATLKIHSTHTSGKTATETLDVRIPPGVKEGAKIRVRGKGEDGIGGSGDLYITVHVRGHDYFRREGDDIYVEVPIGITEAALGAKVDVPTVDGMMTVTIPAGTSSSRRLRLRGKGVAALGKSTRGDQYVEIKIVAPTDVPAEAAELLQKFRKEITFDPRADVPWK